MLLDNPLHEGNLLGLGYIVSGESFGKTGVDLEVMSLISRIYELYTLTSVRAAMDGSGREYRGVGQRKRDGIDR
jgi:hypothetical protein